MIQLRRSGDRGHADHGWLDSYHSFSFADYHDPDFMGFRVLRVINEDYISGGRGFPTHPHRDMEIVTYIIDGELAHQDTLGTKAVIRPGEVQRMTAGTGIQHSEFNSLKDKRTHLLQIWILPEKAGLAPSYGQKSFAAELAKEDLVLLASRDGELGSVTLNQDIKLYGGKWSGARAKNFAFKKGRYGWIQNVSGTLEVSGKMLAPGDAAAISGEEQISLQASGAVEFLLFDLP